MENNECSLDYIYTNAVLNIIFEFFFKTGRSSQRQMCLKPMEVILQPCLELMVFLIFLRVPSL